MIQYKLKPMSIRLLAEQYERIDQLAKEKQITVSRMFRIILDDWIIQQEKKSISLLDEAKTKAISEILYITRRLADRIDPDLKDAAKGHAEEVLAKIKESYL